MEMENGNVPSCKNNCEPRRKGRRLVLSLAIQSCISLAITLAIILSRHSITFQIKSPPSDATANEIDKFIQHNQPKLSDGSLICPCGGYYFADIHGLDTLPVSFHLISRSPAESDPYVRDVLPPGNDDVIPVTTLGFRQPFSDSLCRHVVVAQNNTYLNLTDIFCGNLLDAVGNYLGLHLVEVQPFFNPRHFLNKIGIGLYGTMEDVFNNIIASYNSTTDQQQINVLNFVRLIWGDMLLVSRSWNKLASVPQDSDYWQSIHDYGVLNLTAQNSGMDKVNNVSANTNVAFGMNVNWTSLYLSCGPSYCHDMTPSKSVKGITVASQFGGLLSLGLVAFSLVIYWPVLRLVNRFSRNP